MHRKVVVTPGDDDVLTDEPGIEPTFGADGSDRFRRSGRQGTDDEPGRSVTCNGKFLRRDRPFGVTQDGGVLQSDAGQRNSGFPAEHVGRIKASAKSGLDHHRVHLGVRKHHECGRGEHFELREHVVRVGQDPSGALGHLADRVGKPFGIDRHLVHHDPLVPPLHMR